MSGCPLLLEGENKEGGDIIHPRFCSLRGVLIMTEKRKGIHTSFLSRLFILEAADGLGSVGLGHCLCSIVVPGFAKHV